MDLSSKNIILLLFVVFLSSLHHIHARESQSFSKLTTIPNKEDQEPNSYISQQQEQDQNQNPTTFIPQTQTKPHQYPFQNPNTHNNNYLYNKQAYHATHQPQDNNYLYTKQAYVTYQPQGMRDTTRYMHRSFNNNGGYSHNTQLMDRGYNGKNTNNYYNGGNKYHHQQQQQQHPIQQQGMSDTRFLENGKYYYDLESENKYNQGYQNSKSAVYNYNDIKGYSGKSYEYNANSMNGKYQNDRDQFMN